VFALTSKITRRGYDPDDEKIFSMEGIKKLKVAQVDVQWLLDRGYKIKHVVEFVGNHYQLTARARTALQRSCASSLSYEKRKSSILPPDKLKDGCIYIDGFNLIITLEVALSGSAVLLGRDGVLRDLAGLRGTYKIIDKTDLALDLIGRTLRKYSVPMAKFYLDDNVSNSGRLKAKILEWSEVWGIPTEVELISNVDSVLSKMDRIVTGDSVLLDECGSWFNLSRMIVDNYINDAWIVDLCNE
jgi:hypothetical protein